MTYVFYDTETTGTDTAFDQILQFAAIRTDDDLNETGRFEIRCRLLPHVVPAPEAIQVTGIAPERLDDPALPSHYEMACAIHERLSDWSPAVFLGWNSIHFDEHMLRQAFYQNLLPPYLTNTHGNGRADMLHIARAACSLSPGLLTVPTDADGQPRYALDRIAPANGHPHADAHDALADADATLHMARLVMNGAPDLWRAFTRLATKKAATRFVRSEPVFHLFRRGAGSMAWTPATPIGANPDNPAEIRLYDLDIDPADLARLSHDELAARAVGSNPPLVRLKTNQCPIALTPDQAANAGLAAPECLRLMRDRVERLCNERELRERLLAALPPKQPADTIHVEQRIYDGFPSSADQDAMRRFHTLPWNQRPAVVDTFRDGRLRHLGNRLLFIERPRLLSPAYRRTCLDAMHRRLTATAGAPWRTVPAAIAAIDRLLAGTPETADARSDLEHLRVFLSRRIRTSLTTTVLDRLRALIYRRVPRTAAAIVALLLSALPLADSHAQRQPTPVATAFNVAIDDEDMLVRGFAEPLQGTTGRIGVYVQCLRKAGTLQAVLAFGAFPRNKPVQAGIRRPDRTVERFGPVVTATPAHGFHSPRITDRADVLRLIDAAFRSGSLISNGHNSVWNRISEAANRGTADELKRCGRSPADP